MWSLAVVHFLLPSPALGWWCETSARTGCRGHPRHFVLDGSDVIDMFEARDAGYLKLWGQEQVKKSGQVARGPPSALTTMQVCFRGMSGADVKGTSAQQKRNMGLTCAALGPTCRWLEATCPK